MVKKGFVFLLLIGFLSILSGFVTGFSSPDRPGELASCYLEEGPGELGAANVVTSVVVTYRGLDTLGEVTVLFAASVVVSLLVYLNRNISRKRRQGSELLHSSVKLLYPLILLFGAYVFLNGHLSPGGGFQGGAIIASAMVLGVLADPDRSGQGRFLSLVESLSGLVYIILGALGLFLGANHFLDNRILPLGEYGTLFSAGLIPVIYTLIGLKVGAELSSVVLDLKGEVKGEMKGALKGEVE